MVSSWDRRIGDVPAASDMNSSVRVVGYEIINLVAPLGQRTEVTSTRPATLALPRRSPRPVFRSRDSEGAKSFFLFAILFQFCHPDPERNERKPKGEGSAVLRALYVLRQLSERAGMAYDFASRQSRIRPAKAGA